MGINMFIKKIKKYISNIYTISKLRKNNKISYISNVDEKTYLEGRNFIGKNTTIDKSNIGQGTYIGLNCKLGNCQIGRYCSISSYVEVIYGTHPVNTFVSTHPSFYSMDNQIGFSFVESNMFNERKYADSKKSVSVIIGNDVWIGYGARIMEGITIGNGAIIAAGALVTKDVQPYSIVGGVPAKLIRQRYEEEKIEFLQEFCWWDKDYLWIKNNSEYFADINKFYKKYFNEEDK